MDQNSVSIVHSIYEANAALRCLKPIAMPQSPCLIPTKHNLMPRIQHSVWPIIITSIRFLLYAEYKNDEYNILPKPANMEDPQQVMSFQPSPTQPANIPPLHNHNVVYSNSGPATPIKNGRMASRLKKDDQQKSSNFSRDIVSPQRAQAWFNKILQNGDKSPFFILSAFLLFFKSYTLSLYQIQQIVELIKTDYNKNCNYWKFWTIEKFQLFFADEL